MGILMDWIIFVLVVALMVYVINPLLILYPVDDRWGVSKKRTRRRSIS